MSESYKTWDNVKLLRKANQEWDMAGLARQDRDELDAQRHTTLARMYDEECKKRLILEREET